MLSFNDGVNASSNIALKAISDPLRWKKFVTTMANFRRRIFDENWNASYFFFIVIIQISIANNATNSSCEDNELIEKKQTTFRPLFTHCCRGASVVFSQNSKWHENRSV